MDGNRMLIHLPRDQGANERWRAPGRRRPWCPAAWRPSLDHRANAQAERTGVAPVRSTALAAAHPRGLTALRDRQRRRQPGNEKAQIGNAAGSSTQHDDGDRESRQVLLEGQIAVDGDERLEPVLRSSQEVHVRDRSPARFWHRLHIVLVPRAQPRPRAWPPWSRSGRRTSWSAVTGGSNTHPAGLHSNDGSLGQFAPVWREHLLANRALLACADVHEAHDAAVGQTSSDCQFTEVLIEGDEHTLFPVCLRQDVFIRWVLGQIARPQHVMAGRLEFNRGPAANAACSRSSGVSPAASMPRTCSTASRRPRMMGLPPKMFGFTVIRSSSFCSSMVRPLPGLRRPVCRSGCPATKLRSASPWASTIACERPLAERCLGPASFS